MNNNNNNYGNFQQQQYGAPQNMHAGPPYGQAQQWSAGNPAGGGANWASGPGMQQPPPPGGWTAPRVQLQPHHWNAQGPMFMPAMGMHPQQQFMQAHMMHPQQLQHFSHQQQQQRQGHYAGRSQGRRQQAPPHQPPAHQQHTHGAQQPPPPPSERPQPRLLPPPAKRQRKKDIVPPLEKVTEDPVVREPQNAAERAEVEAWKAERRRHWPSEANLEAKDKEREARRARGELDLGDDPRARLREILAKQRAMGLSRKAGTEDLFFEVSAPRGRGRGRGGRGVGRGMQRGRGRQGFGWEALLDGAAAGDGLLTDPRWQPQAGVEHHQRTAGPAISKEAAPAATEPATEAQASKSVPKEGLDALLAYGSDPDEAVEGGKEPVSAAGGGSKGVGAPSPPANANGAPVDHRKVNFAASAAAGRGTRGGRGRGSQSERGRGRGRGANPGRQPWQAPPRPMEPSLLEKLLSKEIRQDRSYLLQAFRFFVLNGFLVNYGNGEPLQFPRSAPAVDEGADGDGRSNKPSVKDILASGAGVDIKVSESEGEEDRDGDSGSSNYEESESGEEEGEKESSASEEKGE